MAPMNQRRRIPGRGLGQGPRQPGGPRQIPRRPGGPDGLPGGPGFESGSQPIDTLPEGPFPKGRGQGPKPPSPGPIQRPGPDTTMPIGPGMGPGDGMIRLDPREWGERGGFGGIDRMPQLPGPVPGGRGGGLGPFPGIKSPHGPGPTGPGGAPLQPGQPPPQKYPPPTDTLPGGPGWSGQPVIREPGPPGPKGYGANAGGGPTYQGAKGLQNLPMWQNLNNRQAKALDSWFRNQREGGGGGAALDQLFSSSMAPQTLYGISQKAGLDFGKLLADVNPSLTGGSLSSVGHVGDAAYKWQNDPKAVQAMANQIGPGGMHWSMAEQINPGVDYGGPPGGAPQPGQTGYNPLQGQSLQDLLGALGPGFQFAPWAGQFYGGVRPPDWRGQQLPPPGDVMF